MNIKRNQLYDAEFCLQLWNTPEVQQKAQLKEGEIARQVPRYQPYYFITNRARVFSLYNLFFRNGTGWLRPYAGAGKDRLDKLNNGNTMKQNRLQIQFKDGSAHNMKISRLVATAFPELIDRCVLNNDTAVLHHKPGHDPSLPECNYPDNLEWVDDLQHRQTLHLLSDIKDGNPRNPEKLLLSIAELAKGLDEPYMAVEVTENNEHVNCQSFLVNPDSQGCQYLMQQARFMLWQQEQRAKAQYLHMHPEQARVKDGQLTFEGEIDPESDYYKYKMEECTNEHKEEN